MRLQVALLFAMECLAVTSGLTCRYLESCIGSHSNCSVIESSIECNGSDDFCYSLLVAQSQSGDDWLQPDAEFLVFKGCASNHPYEFPRCPKHYTECINFSCARCCPTDNCNAVDPRRLLNLLPPPPTSAPATSSPMPKATTATLSPSSTLPNLSTSRADKQHVHSLLCVILSFLLYLRCSLGSIL